MVIDKIKNFYEVRANYFKKKREIANAMCELDYLLQKANYALSNTIDNGFSNEYLVKVAKAYEKHKFGSSIVQEFLEKIDKMFFKDIDNKLKDGLEIVSLKINLDSKGNRDARVIGPINIYVSNAQSNRHFAITVPIKNTMNVDMVRWNEHKEGLYVLWVRAQHIDNSKEACCVFDYSKMPSAIEKYLTGGFDKELDTYMLGTTQKAPSNKLYTYFTNISKPTLEAYEYEYDYSMDSYRSSCRSYSIDDKNDIIYVKQHDLFDQYAWQEFEYPKVNNMLSNCIDDRSDYK